MRLWGAAQWEYGGASGWANGLLADAFEALLAAVYLDRGFSAARGFLLRLIEVPCSHCTCSQP